jgi:thymidylate synthase
MRFDLSDGTVPLVTTKKVRWQDPIKELLWFLTGDTNIRSLLQQGVSIWTDWPLQKYRRDTGHDIDIKDFEARILADEQFALAWGDLGPVYGKQWRRWEGVDGVEIDQVQAAVDLIRNDPASRRIIIEGWNVADLKKMALTPCHKSYQWGVSDGKLHLHLVQRSVDTTLGLP